MARMLGRMRPPWCPICRRPPGPDCPDEGKDVRQVKRAEKREVAEALRHLTAAVRSMPSAPHDPEAAGQVAREVVEWAPIRRRANAVLLGEEE